MTWPSRRANFRSQQFFRIPGAEWLDRFPLSVTTNLRLVAARSATPRQCRRIVMCSRAAAIRCAVSATARWGRAIRWAIPTAATPGVSAQFEAIIPLPAKFQTSARLSLFYDIGQSFYLGDTEFRNQRGDRTDYHFDLGELRSSAGIAIQWLSPMGLFRFSYAVPLRCQDETRREFGDELEEIPVFGRHRVLTHDGVHVMTIRNGAVPEPDRPVRARAHGCGGGGEESGADPKIRLLNLSTGYTALDLMTNLDADDDDDDETQATGVALETVSDYATLDPDDYTVKVRRTGSGSVLRSFAGEELVEDTINTYVAYGEVGSFGALRIDDTLDEADAGETKLSVANVSSAGALDVYLTDANTDLDDTTPVLSSVGAALVACSAPTAAPIGCASRRPATAPTCVSTCAVFTLTDRGVGSLILTSTQGGMLANAVFLPQGGQPTQIANTKARLRGAVGLANGANASIQVGGQSVLTAATAGVIGSRYTLLDAGTVPVTLTVNGTAVPVPNVDLTAGADYTLLVWSNANGAQTSLIVDDNRLPSGGTAMTKLRLLNGMSTLAAPLTLSVDFSPVIEGTLVGQVSDEIEISSGTDRQFDISNTSTAQSVLTRVAITLAGQLGVHVLHDRQRRDAHRSPAPRPVMGTFPIS